MSTLTYADRGVAAAEPAAAPSPRRPFLARLLDRIVAAQQRRANREIAHYLATRGPLTDELERDIMRRLSGSRTL